MLDSILEITVERVRQRASEGDCPVTAPYSVEHLETAVIMLADRAAQSSGVEDLREALEGIVHFTDGFVVYRTQSPAGVALEQWIAEARSALSASRGEGA